MQFPYWYIEYKKEADLITEYQEQRLVLQTNSIERELFIAKYNNTPISFWDYNPSIETIKEILVLFKNNTVGINFSFFDTSKDDRLWLIDYLNQLIDYKPLVSVINFYFHNTYVSKDMNISNISDDFKVLILDWLTNLNEKPIDVMWVINAIRKALHYA